MSARIDIAGERFGTLVAVRRARHPRTKHWNVWRCHCDCGRVVTISTGTLRAGKHKSCGCRPRTGPYNGRWKGGRTKTNGYIRVWMPGHPRANAIGYVLEHLLVMEQVLGRPVLKTEEVHHRNGRRDDNRQKNLELWTRSQPPGQRVSDMVKFATEILSLYAPKLLRR